MKTFPDLQIAAVATRGLNWAGWLPNGVTVSTVVVTSDISGLTLANNTVSGDITTVKVTANKVGVYQLTFKITLSSGEIEPRTARLKVLNYKGA